MTTTWRLQQLTRVVQEAVKRSGGIWNDEASRFVQQRYIRPHEGLANDQCTAAFKQIDAADSAAKQCAEAAELQQQSTLQLETAGELAQSSENEMKSGFEFIGAGHAVAAKANASIDQAFSELGQAGSACGEPNDADNLRSSVRTRENKREAGREGRVAVVAGLASQLADYYLGDLTGDPIENLVTTLGDPGFRSAARGQVAGWRAALSPKKGSPK